MMIMVSVIVPYLSVRKSTFMTRKLDFPETKDLHHYHTSLWVRWNNGMPMYVCKWCWWWPSIPLQFGWYTPPLAKRMPLILDHLNLGPFISAHNYPQLSPKYHHLGPTLKQVDIISPNMLLHATILCLCW